MLASVISQCLCTGFIVAVRPALVLRLSTVPTATAPAPATAATCFTGFPGLVGRRLRIGHAFIDGGISSQAARHVEFGLHRLAGLLGRSTRLASTTRLFLASRGLRHRASIGAFGGYDIVIEFRRPGFWRSRRTIAITLVRTTASGIVALKCFLAFSHLTRFAGFTNFAGFADLTRRPAFAGFARLTTLFAFSTLASTTIAAGAVASSLPAIAGCRSTRAGRGCGGRNRRRQFGHWRRCSGCARRATEQTEQT